MKVFRTGGIHKLPKTYNAQIKELPKMPVAMAQSIYEMYCKECGDGQSFERMSERGGFGTVESLYYLWAKILELEGE